MKLRDVFSKKSINKNTIFYLAATLAMAAIIWYSAGARIEYSPVDVQGAAFVPGRVVEILNDETDVGEGGLRFGQQDLRVQLLAGERKGEYVEISNVLSVDHSVYAKTGQRIIVYLEPQTDSGYSFTMVQSYERSWAIYAIAALFCCLLAAVGGKAGARSAFGLAFAFVAIVFLLIPLVVQGAPPALLSLGLFLCIIAVSFISMLGFTKKAAAAMLGAGAGVAICCVLYLAMSQALHVTGYNIQAIDTFVDIMQNTDIKVEELMFVGVVVASLGAAMQVSATVASNVAELREADPGASYGMLFRSGFKAGRGMVGPLANTLVLAFIGTFFVSLALYRIYDLQYSQFINLDDIAVEVLHVIAPPSALVLCAPATAFIASRMYGEAARRKKPHRR